MDGVFVVAIQFTVLFDSISANFRAQSVSRVENEIFKATFAVDVALTGGCGESNKETEN